jgi:hypothetical protein
MVVVEDHYGLVQMLERDVVMVYLGLMRMLIELDGDIIMGIFIRLRLLGSCNVWRGCSILYLFFCKCYRIGGNLI